MTAAEAKYDFERRDWMYQIPERTAASGRLQRARAKHPTPGLSAAEHKTMRDAIAREVAEAEAVLEAVDRKFEAEYDAVHRPAKTRAATTAPLPDIRVSGRAAIVPTSPPMWTLSIVVENHSSVDFFLGNVVIDTAEGKQFFPAKHFATGEWNGERKIEPGNSYSFLVDPKALLETVATYKLIAPAAVDKIGRRFGADPKVFGPVFDSILRSHGVG